MTDMIDSRTGELVALDTLTEREPERRCNRCSGPLEDDRGGQCWSCWEFGDTEDEA